MKQSSMILRLAPGRCVFVVVVVFFLGGFIEGYSLPFVACANAAYLFNEQRRRI